MSSFNIIEFIYDPPVWKLNRQEKKLFSLFDAVPYILWIERLVVIFENEEPALMSFLIKTADRFTKHAHSYLRT